MISTSGIRSAGEKKCRPMKFAARALAPARPVIGSVEVFEAKIAVDASSASASRVTRAFSSRSSNTASMTSSQPARSAALSVGRISASVASCFSCVSLPFASCLPRIFAE